MNNKENKLSILRMDTAMRLAALYRINNVSYADASKVMMDIVDECKNDPIHYSTLLIVDGLHEISKSSNESTWNVAFREEIAKATRLDKMYQDALLGLK